MRVRLLAKTPLALLIPGISLRGSRAQDLALRAYIINYAESHKFNHPHLRRFFHVTCSSTAPCPSRQDGVKVTKGTITKVDKDTKTVVVKSADGTEESFEDTGDAAKDAAAQVTSDDVHHAAVSASASLLAISRDCCPESNRRFQQRNLRATNRARIQPTSMP